MRDPSPTPSAPTPPKRRSCLGRFLVGGLGCLAFLVGVLAALFLLTPRLVGFFLPGLVEKGFEGAFLGKLKIGEVDLSWRSRQRLRAIVLCDPDGGEVLRAELELPSLLALLEGPTEAGLFELTLSADLVADDAGRTNLERALEPRPGVRADTSRDSRGEVGLEGSFAFDLELLVRASRIRWSDVQTRRLGLVHELRDLELRLVAPPAGLARLTLTTDVVTGETSRLEAEARFPLGEVLGGRFDPARSDFEARLTASELPVGWIDRAARLEGALEELLGSRAGLRLSARPDERGATLASLSLESERARAKLSARLADGRLTGADHPFLDLALPAPRLLLAGALADQLPAGAELLVGGDPAATWRLQVPELEVDLPSAWDASGILAALAGARTSLSLEVPTAFDWSDPRTRESGLILGLRGFHLEARLAPDEPATASFFTALDTGVPGDLQLDLSVQELGASIAEGRRPLGTLDLQVRGVSEGLLDALAGADGCLAEALQGQLSGRVLLEDASADEQRLSILLRSVGLSGNLVARAVGGELEVAEDALALFLRPPPGVFERCVAPRLGLADELAFLVGPEPLKLVAGPLSLPLSALEADDPAGAVLAALHVRAAVDLGSWRLADLRSAEAREAGAPIAARFSDGRLALALERDTGFSARLDGKVALGDTSRQAPSRLALGLGLAEPGRAVTEGTLAGGRLTLSLETLPAELGRLLELEELALDGPLALELAELSLEAGDRPLLARLGLRASLALGALRATLPAGTLALDAPTAKLMLSGGVVARAEVECGLELALAEGGSLELVASSEAPGASGPGAAAAGEVASGAPRLRVLVEDLRPAAGASELPSGLVRLTLGSLRFTDAAGADVRLDRVALALEAPANRAPSARLGAGISADPPGRIELKVTGAAPLARAPDGELLAPALSLELDLVRVPTALVDALAHQEGMLLELLGPHFDLTAQGRGLTAESGKLTLRARSPTASLAATARMQDGKLELPPEDGAATATFGLGPLSSRKLVGPLLPLFVDLEKPEGSPPASLRVESLSMRLEQGLADLDARLVLDLGLVSYQLLPGLRGSFARELIGTRSAAFAPLSLRIEDGVVHTSGIPLPLGGGRSTSFAGSYSLVDGALSLDGELPLAALGGDVVQALGKARTLLGPDLVVPLEIRGTVSSPRVRPSDAFLERVLREASRGLLEGLLDRKKKD